MPGRTEVDKRWNCRMKRHPSTFGTVALRSSTTGVVRSLLLVLHMRYHSVSEKGAGNDGRQ